MVNGISSNADRMLQSYMSLALNDKEKLLNFRLDLIGWMLPKRNHSVYEIFQESHLICVH